MSSRQRAGILRQTGKDAAAHPDIIDALERTNIPHVLYPPGS